MSNQVFEFFKSQIGREVTAAAPPFTQWLRGTFRKVEEGSMTMEFVVRHEMLNPAGLLHGGVQNAMIDDVMGMTVAALGAETTFVSLNLAVDHLGKSREGDRVLATSRVVRRGKTVINIECDLTDPEGKLLARGTANYIRTELPAFSPRG